MAMAKRSASVSSRSFVVMPSLYAVAVEHVNMAGHGTATRHGTPHPGMPPRQLRPVAWDGPGGRFRREISRNRGWNSSAEPISPKTKFTARQGAPGGTQGNDRRRGPGPEGCEPAPPGPGL